MKNEKYLYIIGGPTASGKTQMAIDLALKWNTEIISADSRQFYREMNIGTAKPTKEQLAQVPHHFINNISIHDVYDVGKYEMEVMDLLEDLFKRNNKVIMAGGSGLFIRSVTDGLDSFPPIDPEVRNEVRSIYETEGLTKLQTLLKEKDQAFYSKTDIQNPRRLLRALEVIFQTGMPISDFHSGNKKSRPFNIVKWVIDIPRQELYDRINARVTDMVNAGLEEEARSLFEFNNLVPLQTVGYSEWFEYFKGNIDRTKAIELIKQNTRRYAKRQMTWFRNDGGWETLKTDYEQSV